MINDSKSGWEIAPKPLADGVNDGYYYHVTNESVKQSILDNGLCPGYPSRYIEFDDRVFVSDRNGVEFWFEFVDTCCSSWDDPVVILRILKSKVKSRLIKDELGSVDSGARAWFSHSIIRAVDKHKVKITT